MHIKPVLLIILDGFGWRDNGADNAISLARKPYIDQLLASCPHTTIEACGASVGLPSGQMGNSEVGHLNIGAGRVVYQDLTRISRAIEHGWFQENPELVAAVKTARESGSRLHIFGLLSDGGVHSLDRHIYAMMEMAKAGGVGEICLHAFLDGRDTPPQSARKYLEEAEALCAKLGNARVASVSGRYFAMDRDKRWDRVRLAYDAMTDGAGALVADSAVAALDAAYARGENDEFVKPTLVVPSGAVPAFVADGDVVVFMNFRSDRAREITQAFIEPEFRGFERRTWPKLAKYVSLTSYNDDFPIPVAFPPERLDNSFGEYLSGQGLRQLRIAETEKYAHVTFFFDGGVETPFPGEERILVPSPDVPTYDLKPEMSAEEVTDRLVEAIKGKTYDAIICNYANCDMVGHTGILDATVKAVETLDGCLARVVPAMVEAGGEVLITADHGNADKMYDEATHHPHTAHTMNPVPVIYVGRPARFTHGGALEDIAPTLLKIMGLEQPREMTGRSLLDFE